MITEQSLTTTVSGDAVVLGPLDRLLTPMALPRIALGIVPARATYEAPTINGFIMFDRTMIHVETISAELTITQPREVAVYEHIFKVLGELAVYGDTVHSGQQRDRRHHRDRTGDRRSRCGQHGVHSVAGHAHRRRRDEHTPEEGVRTVGTMRTVRGARRGGRAHEGVGFCGCGHVVWSFGRAGIRCVRGGVHVAVANGWGSPVSTASAAATSSRLALT
ncbi:Scr1 family TA system antitoxin-like transcriptional regulator [Nocardia sp. NRRL WC-3656]|uniref:Scr1 family TA system antitoxin-like transcriptional regulator n=1 Tax=Nocardia sp. NRRL WC-3656 TaxID=1463824 RepID=UPI00350F6A14